VYFANRTLLTQVSSSSPTFNVSQLDANTSYQIKVYVTQGPVTSPPVLVSAYTSRTPPVKGNTEMDEEMKIKEVRDGGGGGKDEHDDNNNNHNHNNKNNQKGGLGGLEGLVGGSGMAAVGGVVAVAVLAGLVGACRRRRRRRRGDSGSRRRGSRDKTTNNTTAARSDSVGNSGKTNANPDVVPRTEEAKSESKEVDGIKHEVVVVVSSSTQHDTTTTSMLERRRGKSSPPSGILKSTTSTSTSSLPHGILKSSPPPPTPLTITSTSSSQKSSLSSPPSSHKSSPPGILKASPPSILKSTPTAPHNNNKTSPPPAPHNNMKASPPPAPHKASPPGILKSSPPVRKSSLAASDETMTGTSDQNSSTKGSSESFFSDRRDTTTTCTTTTTSGVSSPASDGESRSVKRGSSESFSSAARSSPVDSGRTAGVCRSPPMDYGRVGGILGLRSSPTGTIRRESALVSSSRSSPSGDSSTGGIDSPPSSGHSLKSLTGYRGSPPTCRSGLPNSSPVEGHRESSGSVHSPPRCVVVTAPTSTSPRRTSKSGLAPGGDGGNVGDNGVATSRSPLRPGGGGVVGYRSSPPSSTPTPGGVGGGTRFGVGLGGRSLTHQRPLSAVADIETNPLRKSFLLEEDEEEEYLRTLNPREKIKYKRRSREEEAGRKEEPEPTKTRKREVRFSFSPLDHEERRQGRDEESMGRHGRGGGGEGEEERIGGSLGRLADDRRSGGEDRVLVGKGILGGKRNESRDSSLDFRNYPGTLPRRLPSERTVRFRTHHYGSGDELDDHMDGHTRNQQLYDHRGLGGGLPRVDGGGPRDTLCYSSERLYDYHRVNDGDRRDDQYYTRGQFFGYSETEVNRDDDIYPPRGRLRYSGDKLRLYNSSGDLSYMWRVKDDDEYIDNNIDQRRHSELRSVRDEGGRVKGLLDWTTSRDHNVGPSRDLNTGPTRDRNSPTSTTTKRDRGGPPGNSTGPPHRGGYGADPHRGNKNSGGPHNNPVERLLRAAETVV
ncbi:hypothetical protein Pmani_036019, partial [Petrolisthes manimaculis]